MVNKKSYSVIIVLMAMLKQLARKRSLKILQVLTLGSATYSQNTY